VRVGRAADRAREGVHMDPLEFEKISNRDESYGAAELGEIAADAQVDNSGDLRSFLLKIDTAVTKLRAGQRSLRRRRVELAANVASVRSREEVMAALLRVSEDLIADSGSEISSRGKSLVEIVADADLTLKPS